MRWILGIAVIATLTTSGCTNLPDRPQPTPTSAREAPDFMIAVTEKLGPVPPHTVYLPDQEEQARIAKVETEWAELLDQYPDAIRPPAVFVRYVDGPERAAAHIDCLAARGFTAQAAPGPEGMGGSYSVTNNADEAMAELTAIWACAVEYPRRPSPPFSAEQLAYLYDYFVEFKVPCLKAAGHPQEQAPTREHFITQWPKQNWYPSARIEPLDSPEWAVVEAACPNAPRGIG